MNTPDGRNTNGKFKAGNTFARLTKGQRRSSTRFLELLRDAVTEADWLAIVARAVSEAKGLVEDCDSKSARDFLARYVIPPSVIERDQDESSLLLS